MEIRRGEFVAVFGKSGCGKSTLLDLLGLVLRPTAAEAFRFRCGDGEEVALGAQASEARMADLRKSEIGYVLQTGGLLPFLSVRKNIGLPRRINGMGREREVAGELAGRLGIADQLGKMPAHLSGGQRQRVAVARAIAHEPGVVLADEPTAAVDELTAREIMRQFSAMTQERGVTQIVVTHQLGLVREYADRFFTFKLHPDPESGRIDSVCYEVERPG